MANIDWKKVGKWALILSPLIIGGTYIIISNKKKNDLASWGKAKTIDKTPDTVKPSTKNSFPLKKGVKNNDYVSQLQRELGVEVDGWFGKDTLAALQEQTGKSEIKDLNDLKQTIQIIKEYWAYYDVSDKTDAVISTYFKDQSSQILVNKDGSWRGVIKDDVDGLYKPSGYVLNVKKGFKLSLEDYLPYAKNEENGKLLIEVIKDGANKGIWETDPTNISLI